MYYVNMKPAIVSRFRDKPELCIICWAMGLGLATIFICPLLGISAAVVVPALTKAFGEGIGSAFGLNFGFLAFLITIAAIVVGSIGAA